MPSPIETERKYLIAYPDTAALSRMKGVEVWHITQTYLLAPGERVRKIGEGASARYIHTAKHRISALSSYEVERVLTPEEYTDLLRTADPERHPIVKTRYRIPEGGFLWEIDVYSFWDDRATLEVELADESQTPSLPTFVQVIRELTGDRRYSNRALAKEVPMDGERI